VPPTSMPIRMRRAILERQSGLEQRQSRENVSPGTVVFCGVAVIGGRCVGARHHQEMWLFLDPGRLPSCFPSL
jgi:hypothetical protein